MSTQNVLVALFSVTALAVVGCAADPVEEDPAAGEAESAETASRPIAVSGAEAIRLRATLLGAGATGDPVAAIGLRCTPRICSFAPGKAGAPELQRIDPIGKAQALFDALSAVRYPNGMYGSDGHAGTVTAAAASIDCSKTGGCRVVHYGGDTAADVTGYAASTIRSALAQWGVSTARNVVCDAHANPLSPSEALANVTTYDCSLDGKPEVADPAPIAGALFEALRSAGAPVTGGYGGSHGSTEPSIAVQSVSCRSASSCTIVPPDCRTSGCATGSSCMFCAARYQCLPTTARCN